MKEANTDKTRSFCITYCMQHLPTLLCYKKAERLQYSFHVISGILKWKYVTILMSKAYRAPHGTLEGFRTGFFLAASNLLWRWLTLSSIDVSQYRPQWPRARCCFMKHFSYVATQMHSQQKLTAKEGIFHPRNLKFLALSLQAVLSE